MNENSVTGIFRKWFEIALFNLLLVSLLGLLMRYKIGFSLPWVNQRYILNAHSHFAFAGWLSQVLMTFLAAYIARRRPSIRVRKYNILLSLNLLSAYGMLFSFPFEGYAAVSISFSTLSIFVSYGFAIVTWRDLNQFPPGHLAHRWFKWALVFNVVSSLGPFTLAYMMATRHIWQNLYLASVYFFLHFQYNGWFFFGFMGLVSEKLKSDILTAKRQRIIFYHFAAACVPAYFLSALWLPVPGIIIAIVVMAAIAQAAGWMLFLKSVSRSRAEKWKAAGFTHRSVLIFSAMAFSIKFILQLGSTFPALSKWAYGFRPIVIGYLHLVFLGGFTLFVLGYAGWQGFLQFRRLTIRAIWVFMSGIILNELFLMAEGLGGITYTSIPYINELLFGAACLMAGGLLVINLSSRESGTG